MSENKDDRPGHHTKRDAETQTILGAFVTAMSIPVLIGTFWAKTSHAAVVNVGAGLVLLGIGVAMILWGRRTAKKAAQLSDRTDK